MSTPRAPKPARLVVGLFMGEREFLLPAAESLCRWFGPVDTVSRWFSFHHTQYYQPEMGAPLFRRMLAFRDLIGQEELAEIKIRTNGLEEQYCRDGKRRVNIDPGYLVHERFVLASGKNFSHRIYVGKGIYADLTLVYRDGGYQRLPWTYPDYASREIREFLESVRKKYVLDMKTQMSEIRGRRSEIRDQRSEVGGQRSEVRGRRSEVRTLNAEP